MVWIRYCLPLSLQELLSLFTVGSRAAGVEDETPARLTEEFEPQKTLCVAFFLFFRLLQLPGLVWNSSFPRIYFQLRSSH